MRLCSRISLGLSVRTWCNRMGAIIDGDIEDQLFQWGKWAYCNVDQMMGASPPGWVTDMIVGYELDDRQNKQQRIEA